MRILRRNLRTNLFILLSKKGNAQNAIILTQLLMGSCWMKMRTRSAASAMKGSYPRTPKAVIKLLWRGIA
jgi:hypothetical protein